MRVSGDLWVWTKQQQPELKYAIKHENGSEQYIIGEIGSRTIRHTSHISQINRLQRAHTEHDQTCAAESTGDSLTIKQWRRRLAARLFPPLIWGLIRLIWKTCRIKTIIGQEHLDALLSDGEPFIPCYWHQQQIFCVRYLLDQAATNNALKLGYLISPSKDGDIATSMFGDQGVHIIRGSATRGGAQALREIYTVIKKDKISPIVTPDGPTGPIYECKPGVAMLAQLSKAPLLPIAYAASGFWCLTSWDRFMIPKPFSDIVVGVAPALRVDKSDAADGFAKACSVMNERLNSLSENCEQTVPR